MNRWIGGWTDGGMERCREQLRTNWTTLDGSKGPRHLSTSSSSQNLCLKQRASVAANQPALMMC